MAILYGRNQLWVLICFFVSGFVAGLFYDALKLKRMVLFDGKAVLFVDDLLFCAFCSLLVIIGSFGFNDGNIKWFEIPAMALGLWLYKALFSSTVIKFFAFIINLVKRLMRVLLMPFKLAFSQCGSLLIYAFTLIYLFAVMAYEKRRMFNKLYLRKGS